jgi:Fe-S-cluster containining protein
MDYRTTKAFDHFLAGLDPGARENALGALAREAQAIRALPPGPERAREVHRRVDEALARFEALRPDVIAQVRCGRGCAHCCRLWVGVTRDEAALLAGRVREGTARPVRARMEAQRTWPAPADFIGRPREEASCTFLGDDGACTVYEDRPSICRAVLVASDPEHCRLGDHSTRITAVINPYVEVVVSAALTVDAEGDPPPPAGRHLASALLEALEGVEDSKPSE